MSEQQLKEMRDIALALEEKLAIVAKLANGKVDESEKALEPNLIAENRFLRAENEILRLKLQDSEELMALVKRQSEMVSRLTLVIAHLSAENTV